MKIDDYGYIVNGYYDRLMIDQRNTLGDCYSGYSLRYNTLDEIMHLGLYRLYNPFLSDKNLFQSGNPLRDDFIIEIAHNVEILGRAMFTWISDDEIEIFALPCALYDRCLYSDIQTINKNLSSWLGYMIDMERKPSKLEHK